MINYINGSLHGFYGKVTSVAVRVRVGFFGVRCRFPGIANFSLGARLFFRVISQSCCSGTIFFGL